MRTNDSLTLSFAMSRIRENTSAKKTSIRSDNNVLTLDKDVHELLLTFEMFKD